MKGRFFTIMLCLVGLCCTSIACHGKSENNNDPKDKDMKTLVVYFSYSAGNTKGIAEKVQKAVGGDIVRLETVKPYSDNYQTVVDQGQEEVESGYKPELKPIGVNVQDYDRIIIGTPTWWYKMTPAVLSFISNNDFTGKIVVPFSTHAGWPGSVIKDMTAAAEKKGATVVNGKEFKFSPSDANRNRMITTEAELNKWIDSLK